MQSVFISYAHRDAKEAADFLYRRLKGAGFAVYKDDLLRSGAEFPVELVTNIHRRDCFVVLISKRALESDWVRRQIDEALSSGRRIIPVRVYNTVLPAQLQTLHALEMQRRERWWQTLHKLVSDLEETERNARIPRVFNMSEHIPFEGFHVEGVLILNQNLHRHMALTEPGAVEKTARQFVHVALPCLQETNAGIVPPGHAALACAILANLLGWNLLPRIYWPYRVEENERFRISSRHSLLMQALRERAHRDRSEDSRMPP